MSFPTRETISRTTLIEMEDGRSAAEAEEIVRRYAIQIDVGPFASASPTLQAALLTAVNTAHRAAPGGVRVRMHEEAKTLSPWANGKPLSEAVIKLGGRLVEQLDNDKPTIAIGAHPLAPRPNGSIVVWVTSDGWRGGVVSSPERMLPITIEMPLAGVLAGAVGVSEAFQHLRGYAPPGRRDAGVSLWSPDLHWLAPNAVGPQLTFLPSRLWMLGLGHLGQAFAWSLGFLPYAETNAVRVMLQDFDRIESANLSTGLLTFSGDLGERKTHIVARRLEALGFDILITDRRFDSSTQRRLDLDEPGVALAGFDKIGPRRLLEKSNFTHVVDAGLGLGRSHFLDMQIQTFPGPEKAEDAFIEREREAGPTLGDGYEREIKRRIEAGENEKDARCGVERLAGATVAASFVGAVASSLVLADTLRALNGGARYDVVSFSLRSLEARAAESVIVPPPDAIPGTGAAGLVG
jgi:hypothetical protein